MGHLRLPGVGQARFESDPTGGSEPPKPTDPLPPPMLPPSLPPVPTTAPPPVPYPGPEPIPFVPPGARTWFQANPWVLPVGGGVAALIIGIAIGAAIGRRPRAA
jgi:hypothetical protein